MTPITSVIIYHIFQFGVSNFVFFWCAWCSASIMHIHCEHHFFWHLATFGVDKAISVRRICFTRSECVSAGFLQCFVDDFAFLIQNFQFDIVETAIENFEN